MAVEEIKEIPFSALTDEEVEQLLLPNPLDIVCQKEALENVWQVLSKKQKQALQILKESKNHEQLRSKLKNLSITTSAFRSRIFRIQKTVQQYTFNQQVPNVEKPIMTVKQETDDLLAFFSTWLHGQRDSYDDMRWYLYDEIWQGVFTKQEIDLWRSCINRHSQERICQDFKLHPSAIQKHLNWMMRRYVEVKKILNNPQNYAYQILQNKIDPVLMEQAIDHCPDMYRSFFLHYEGRATGQQYHMTDKELAQKFGISETQASDLGKLLEKRYLLPHHNAIYEEIELPVLSPGKAKYKSLF